MVGYVVRGVRGRRVCAHRVGGVTPPPGPSLSPSYRRPSGFLEKKLRVSLCTALWLSGSGEEPAVRTRGEVFSSSNLAPVLRGATAENQVSSEAPKKNGLQLS